MSISAPPAVDLDERRDVHAELDRVYACWSSEALRYQKAVDTTRAYVEATKDVLRSAEAAATAAQGGLGHARRPDRGRQSKTRAIRCSRAPRTPVSRYSITAT